VREAAVLALGDPHHLRLTPGSPAERPATTFRLAARPPPPGADPLRLPDRTGAAAPHAERQDRPPRPRRAYPARTGPPGLRRSPLRSGRATRRHLVRPPARRARRHPRQLLRPRRPLPPRHPPQRADP